MTHSKISIILLLSLILCKSNGYIMANPMAPNDTAAWTQVGLTDKLVLTFAMMGTNIFAGTEEGIFLSTNDGTSWTPINNGIPNFHWVTSLAVDGTNSSQEQMTRVYIFPQITAQPGALRIMD